MLTPEQQAEFFAHFAPIEDLTYSVILAIVRDRDAALDVLQDTVVLAIRHYDRLRDKDRLKPWMLRIAKNQAISYLRKQGRAKENLLSAEELEPLAVSDEETVEKAVLANERSAALYAALARLDHTDRLLLHLKYNENMTILQIAGLTGFSLSKVKSRLARAYQKLRRLLPEEDV